MPGAGKTWRPRDLFARESRWLDRSGATARRDSRGNCFDHRDARQQRTRHHTGSGRNWENRCRSRYLFSQRCGAIRREDSRGRKSVASGSAFAFRAQILCAQRYRCSVHQERHAAAPAFIWRAPSARVSPRNGKCRGHRRPRQSGGTRKALAGGRRGSHLTTARQTRKRPARARSTRLRKRCRRAAHAEHIQHRFPRHRRRSHDYFARPEGTGLLDRRGMFFRGD